MPDNWGNTIKCIAPGGQVSNHAAVGGGNIQGLGLDGSGTLYYAGTDANGNSQLWRWTSSGSVALLPVPQSVTLTVTVTRTTQPSGFIARYTRDADGRISTKTVTINDSSQSWSYGYDANGRLDLVTEGGATIAYGYDANGNRVSVNGATVATYNARDQLLTYGQNSYTWTADGELATKTTPAGITHYTWTALGELTAVTLPDGTAIHYIYDGLGRRVGREVSGALVAGYLYAGSRIVAATDATGKASVAWMERERNPGWDDTTRIFPGFHFVASGLRRSCCGTYRIVSDQAGSIRLVIDVATGAIVQRIDYDVWGMITADTDPGFQLFGFAGGLWDAGTGLEHFGARDYDPGTGHWISRDQILFAGGDANLYRYAVDDPVNGFDPKGLWSFSFSAFAILAGQNPGPQAGRSWQNHPGWRSRRVPFHQKQEDQDISRRASPLPRIPGTLLRSGDGDGRGAVFPAHSFKVVPLLNFWRAGHRGYRQGGGEE